MATTCAAKVIESLSVRCVYSSLRIQFSDGIFLRIPFRGEGKQASFPLFYTIKCPLFQTFTDDLDKCRGASRSEFRQQHWSTMLEEDKGRRQPASSWNAPHIILPRDLVTVHRGAKSFICLINAVLSSDPLLVSQAGRKVRTRMVLAYVNLHQTCPRRVKH